MKLSTSYQFITKDLNKIESELLSIVQADHPVLRAASTQLLKAGGKRIRPVFVLLAAKFGHYDFDKIKHVATSFELLHMASLVHDDVIDNAHIRRGRETINAKWDNRVSMYTGDYMFAQALESLSSIDDPKAHQILSKTMVELCRGEIEQLKDQYNLNQNLRTYLRRIKRKTALLIASSCHLGAIVSKVDAPYEKALLRYGYYIGMSYQIIDDILDFTATPEKLGKPAGSDLFQGNITLPVLYMLQEGDFKQRLEKGFEKSHYYNDFELLSEIVQEIKHSHVIEESYRVSEMYLQKAYKELEIFPNNKAKKAMMEIAKYIGRRSF
ncbi:heptaprenyl diphosphate synthase component II [Salinibacillus xinjiangensis]|uniref:Heptaprenyl diphosphate synthase component 2 n=1 Tax=Salinibacillus xinjiangensis TaxID=1229268 RepID=A0A6G1X672_9BACI|nr:heptaprenyl diphosphate synthase component II [Salinibacillus xinjiangensis]MRG86405.1 heptaprenyl diphosphate synthase component II [Salinibacillus xinjiangensis]